MKKKFVAALILGALVSALSIPTFVSAARIRASITVDQSAGVLSSDASTVSFNVEADVSKASDLYKLWVANKCSSDGSLVSAEYLPVKDGKASGFTVTPGSDCTAYVWLFPASESPIRGATVSFHVD